MLVVVAVVTAKYSKKPLMTKHRGSPKTGKARYATEMV